MSSKALEGLIKLWKQEVKVNVPVVSLIDAIDYSEEYANFKLEEYLEYYAEQ